MVDKLEYYSGILLILASKVLRLSGSYGSIHNTEHVPVWLRAFQAVLAKHAKFQSQSVSY